MRSDIRIANDSDIINYHSMVITVWVIIYYRNLIMNAKFKAAT